jgi:hypothetical protein
VSINIGDATAIEGSAALKLLDRFVADGSGGLLLPRDSVFGPDGNSDGAQDLYVASRDSDAILRYDGVTGAFLDTFVPSGSGGLDSPSSLVFDPDGNLYVSSQFLGQVFKYNASGSFLGVPVSGLPTNTDGAFGLTFGADGNLYIANSGADDVLRFDGSTVSIFVRPGSGGLSLPRQGVFGPDGNFYVASQNTGSVLRYDGLTGDFLDTFASTSVEALGQGPMWIEFGTDGYLYASVRTTSAGYADSIVRFDAATGAFVDTFNFGRVGWSFTLGPDNVIYYSGNSFGNFIDRFGPSSWAAFTVSLDSASLTPVTVHYSTADGTAVTGSDFSQTSGSLTFAPGQTVQTVLVQALADAAAEPNETFSITLSRPVGATIADSTGVGTITEDGATKFYVVNDASGDSTYMYNAAGVALSDSDLLIDNTSPRGAASNAAGDKVWVVDANKNVYIYSPSGGLLGSWTAGSLASNAQVEGIATNGTDIWLLDNNQDKVYKYSGAASRLSGSQNAASSFNLVNGKNGNSNGKGIVTDGTYLWVVDDATTDKVFKYTVSGTSKGSWTIDTANSAPTGLTINPSNVSDIWIVDSGTKKVYQYTNAAGKTSGSQNAAASFALAAGNTNPQDIADPPAGDMLPSAALAPIAPGLPPDASLNAAAARGPSAGAGAPPLAGRDAVFATLARQFPQDGATPTADAVFAALAQQFLPAGGTPTTVPARPPAAPVSGPNPVDSRAGLALVGRPGASPGPSATDLGDVPLAEADRPSSSLTDAWFTDLGDDPSAPVGADPWLDRPW